jgi:hypothetical protein
VFCQLLNASPGRKNGTRLSIDSAANGIALAYLGDRSRHWRQKFGGLQVDQVKRLKELELENSRLRKSGI